MTVPTKQQRWAAIKAMPKRSGVQVPWKPAPPTKSLSTAEQRARRVSTRGSRARRDRDCAAVDRAAAIRSTA